MKLFYHILAWNVSLALKRGSEAWHGLAFFMMAVTLFPLAIGADPKMLAPIAPAVLWVLAILSSLVSLPSLYQRDWDDGSLDQLMVLPVAREVVVLAKLAAHWLASAFPILLLTPLLAAMLFVTTKDFWVLEISLLLGTLVMTAIGSIGAALVLGHTRSTALVLVITLPLYIPLLVWGVEAWTGVLAAAACILLPCSIWINVALVRMSQE